MMNMQGIVKQAQMMQKKWKKRKRNWQKQK